MTFVASEGAIRSLERASVSSPVRRISLAESYTADYAEIWRRQPEVRTVVDFLGRNIASLGIHTFSRVGDTDRKRLPQHPLARLLAAPGLPGMPKTRYRLIDALVRDKAIYDLAYWWKVRGDGGTRSLVRLPPRMVTPKGDNWLYPDYFEVRGNRGVQRLAPDEVVFFRGYDPDTETSATSPLESLRIVLAEAYSASQMRTGLMNNGARLSGYIKRPAPVAGQQDWSSKARENFKEQWQQQYTGSGEQVGGTPVLEDGMDFVKVSATPEELQYVDVRKLTREEVASAYHIPPPMVGILDHATFSNIEQQHRMLYQDTLGPWLEEIKLEIEAQLLPDLDTDPAVYVEFNLASKLAGSFEEQVTTLVGATGGPFMTRAEARARQNLPHIEGTDDLILPLNLADPAAQPAGSPAEDQEA